MKRTLLTWLLRFFFVIALLSLWVAPASAHTITSQQKMAPPETYACGTETALALGDASLRATSCFSASPFSDSQTPEVNLWLGSRAPNKWQECIITIYVKDVFNTLTPTIATASFDCTQDARQATVDNTYFSTWWNAPTGLFKPKAGHTYIAIATITYQYGNTPLSIITLSTLAI